MAVKKWRISARGGEYVLLAPGCDGGLVHFLAALFTAEHPVQCGEHYPTIPEAFQGARKGMAYQAAARGMTIAQTWRTPGGGTC